MPALPIGLLWENNLALDGSIQVRAMSERFWINPAGGPYHVAANWLGGAVPTAADSPQFATNASYQITWTADARANRASFNAASGIVTQALGAFTWQLTNGYVLGEQSNASPIVAHVSGTLRVTNAAGTAELEVRRGTNRILGGVVEADRVLATNLAGRLVLESGKLITRGGTVGSSGPFAVGLNSPVPALWDVRAGAPTRVTVPLNVGSNAPGSALLITNGGTLINGSAVIGRDASNAVLWVAGPGSMWSNTAGLNVGLGTNSSGNLLVVSNGASAFAGQAVNLGGTVGGGLNRAFVHGAGTLWHLAAALSVGGSSHSNRLEILAGGQLATTAASASGAATLGLNGGAHFNEALVSGAGSLWSNASPIRVGHNGNSNRLVVANEGQLLTRGVVLGTGATPLGNEFVVDGGQAWVTNGNHAASLTPANGKTRLLDGQLVTDLLWLTNANGAFEFDGGTLATDWINAPAGGDFIVGRAGSIPAVWRHTGTELAMLIPDRGPAVPYPATIPISGLTGLVNRVAVSLNGLSHTFPNDLSIMLVSPTDFGVILMSSAASGAINGVNLAFAPEAAFNLPTSGTITNGLYRPTSPSLAVALPPPAPGVFDRSTNLLSFNGANPNGAWRLFVVDQLALDEGSLRGWSLRIETDAGEVVEAGSGSAASRVGQQVIVGDQVANCEFHLPSAATKLAADGLLLGRDSSSTGNRAILTGGALWLTNDFGTATLEVRRGTSQFDAGEIRADRLRLTNALGQFDFNGGALHVGASEVVNGSVFFVGNGLMAATLNLTGAGAHTFAGGLTLRAGATLTGNGTLAGALTALPGSVIAPGASVGRLALDTPPTLAGTLRLKLRHSSGVLTNDVLQCAAPLVYGGALEVTHVGPDPLAVGQRFRLFHAPAYSGAFASLSLPPLAPGLVWRDNLTLDGSLEVISAPATPLSFTSVAVSGGQLLIAGAGGTPGASYLLLGSTNTALPLLNWTRLATNTFDASGNFQILTPILPTPPQQFYRLQLP